jgi:hypothetical protein
MSGTLASQGGISDPALITLVPALRQSSDMPSPNLY